MHFNGAARSLHNPRQGAHTAGVSKKDREAVVQQISNWNFCKDKILNYIILCGKQQLKNDLSNWQASGQ